MKHAIITILLLFCIHLTDAMSPQAPKDIVGVQIWIYKNSPFKEEYVLRYIKICKIQHPNIVYKQSILETGFYTSNIFKKHNNLFGFMYKDKYHKYNHWTESIEAYKKFQDRKYKGGDYYVFLKKLGYAEDKNYVWKLKHIKL